MHVIHRLDIRTVLFFLRQVLGYADYVFTSVFTVEIILKVITVTMSISFFKTLINVAKN